MPGELDERALGGAVGGEPTVAERAGHRRDVEDRAAPALEQVGDEIFERIIAVASGEETVSEGLDIGQEEFVPWQLGTVT